MCPRSRQFEWPPATWADPVQRPRTGMIFGSIELSGAVMFCRGRLVAAAILTQGCGIVVHQLATSFAPQPRQTKRPPLVAWTAIIRPPPYNPSRSTSFSAGTYPPDLATDGRPVTSQLTGHLVDGHLALDEMTKARTIGEFNCE